MAGRRRKVTFFALLRVGIAIIGAALTVVSATAHLTDIGPIATKLFHNFNELTHNLWIALFQLFPKLDLHLTRIETQSLSSLYFFLEIAFARKLRGEGYIDPNFFSYPRGIVSVALAIILSTDVVYVFGKYYIWKESCCWFLLWDGYYSMPWKIAWVVFCGFFFLALLRTYFRRLRRTGLLPTTEELDAELAELDRQQRELDEQIAQLPPDAQRRIRSDDSVPDDSVDVDVRPRDLWRSFLGWSTAFTFFMISAPFVLELSMGPHGVYSAVRSALEEVGPLRAIASPLTLGLAMYVSASRHVHVYLIAGLAALLISASMFASVWAL